MSANKGKRDKHLSTSSYIVNVCVSIYVTTKNKRLKRTTIKCLPVSHSNRTSFKLAWQPNSPKWQAFIVNKCELFYVNI